MFESGLTDSSLVKPILGEMGYTFFNQKEKVKIDLTRPFDLLNLPSLGKYYQNGKSELMIRYLTNQEENILTNPNLVESGKAIECVLDSVIVDDDFKSNDLLYGDLQAIVLFLRSTSYGDVLDLKMNCPSCGSEQRIEAKISNLKIKEVKNWPDENGILKFNMPKSDLVFFFKLLPYKNYLKHDVVNFGSLSNVTQMCIGFEYPSGEEKIRKIYFEKNNQEPDNLQLAHFILKNMPFKDYSHIKKFIENSIPGVDDSLLHVCQSCEYKIEYKLGVSHNFLSMSPELKNDFLTEIFYLYYYGKGITRNEAVNMPVYERRFNLNKIQDEMEKKRKAEEEAYRSAKSSGGKRF